MGGEKCFVVLYERKDFQGVKNWKNVIVLGSSSVTV